MKVAFVMGITLTLTACSTAIKYHAWDGVEPVESTALKFRLTDSSITFALPDPPASGAAGASAPKVASECPDGVSANDWWRCFNRVTPRAAMAPLDQPDAKVRPGKFNFAPEILQTYVATPADASHLYFSRTTLTGTPIPALDGIYSQVTVKYGNNAATIIAGASAGAVTGFGIAGPYGAAAGFIIGAAGAAGGAAPGAAVPKVEGNPFLCEGEPVDLPLGQSFAGPAIKFPVTIKESDGRPFAIRDDITRPPVGANGNVTSRLPNAECWHELPNVTSLDVMVAAPAASSSIGPRAPEAGDGWLYRIVLVDPKPPRDAVPASTYFASEDVRQDFPYSSCRKARVQVTWWQELSLKGPEARVVTFDTVVADPTFLYRAALSKGGVVSFRPDCGAYVTMDRDTSTGPVIAAVVKATTDIYDAEQSWEKSRKK